MAKSKQKVYKQINEQIKQLDLFGNIIDLFGAKDLDKGNVADDIEFESHKLGKHYQYYILDCIIDVAHAVSIDFTNRPEVYKAIDSSLQLILLRRGIGKIPFFPDKDTRIKELFSPFFGSSQFVMGGNNNSRFNKSATDLIAACEARTKNKIDTNDEALLERVRVVNKRFKSYLEGITGTSQEAALLQLYPLFQLSVSVLEDKNIQTIFGVNTEDGLEDNWPFGEELDFNGATLMQNISIQLKDHVNPSSRNISIDAFQNLQSIAITGYDSLIESQKITNKRGDDYDPLVKSVFSWGAELGIIK